MRLPLGLVLGALLGVARADDDLVARQNRDTSSASASASPSSSTDDTTTSRSTSVEVSPSPGGGQDSGRDVTVTSTIFSTTGSVSTTTQITTITSTTTTISTIFSTTTVTGNQATATSTTFETSTVFVDPNQRRALDVSLAARAPTPAHVEAVPTRAPGNDGLRDDRDPDVHDQAAPRLNLLAKRATITEFVTSTVSAGDRVTASATATSFAVKSSLITSVITQTVQPNARTTVGVTSTLTVTSTGISSVVEGKPTAVSDGRGSSDDELSAGTKAGIGVGAAIAALAVIGLVALFFLRLRRRPKPDHDDFIGASEVPVGGLGGRRPAPTPMSEPTSAGVYLPQSHSQRKPGPSVEGYRGTAMGDGRAGYANNLAPYGAAYTPSRSTTLSQQQHRNSIGADNQLPRHPSPGDPSVNSPVSPDAAELGHDSAAAAAWNNPGATEIDGHPVMGHQSGPVYEMPTQSYR